MSTTDEFRGGDAALISQINALLKLDAKGVLVPHGVGGHARALLESAAIRLGRPTQGEPAGDAADSLIGRRAPWIDVRDRLPTHLYSVLGVVVDGPLVVAGDPDDRLRDIVSYSPSRGCWLQYVGEVLGFDAVVTVTHWQDMSDLPAPSGKRSEGGAA